jgi:hypothetical protein
MRWTQLKTALASLRAASVRDRVQLHQARYRYTHEEVGRIWITIDGREVASFDTSSYIRRRAELTEQLMGSGEALDSGQYLEVDGRAREMLRRAGQHDDYEALVDLKTYLSLSLDEALASPSPLVRALAMLDRRLGKRRLRTGRPAPEEHPLVIMMYRLRCGAENVASEPSGPVSEPRAE